MGKHNKTPCSGSHFEAERAFAMLGTMRRVSIGAQVIACALSGALVLTSVITPARAAPDKKALSKARAKFQQATEQEQAGNYAGALAAFREVGQVKMTPQVRYHIAFCEAKLGKLVTALGGYELALQNAQEVGPGFEKEVRTAAEELRARIPKLTITRGKGASAARIEIDGVTLGQSSVGTPMPVDPGPHLVEATVGGSKGFSETVEVAEGDTKSIEIVIESSDVAPSSGPAPSGGPTTEDTGAKRESSSLALPLVVGGIGVASLAASGVFFLMKNDKVSQLDDACGPNRDQCPADSQSTYDDAKRFNTFSQVALGVGVVGVGVAATLLLTRKSSKAPEKSGLSVTPSAPQSQAGMSLVGRF